MSDGKPRPPAPSPSGGEGEKRRDQRISVSSADGVEIVGRASGDGPGLLLVYGAMMEQVGWSRLAAHLLGHTVYTYDRRGRGESGERPHPQPLSLRGEGSLESMVQIEVEDLRAFSNVLSRPLDVFGHSSGALLVLHAMMQGMQARRLVLYEPVLPAVREPKVPGDLPGRILALVAAGDRDAALAAFMRDGMWLSEADIDRARGTERWADQLRYVHTAAYDVHIARTYELEPERLAQLTVPVLLLVGSESPDWMKLGVERFAEALPDARVEMLEGQGHTAMFSAPEVLGEKVRTFLA